MVGRDGLNAAVGKGLPQNRLILLLAHGRRADIARGGGIVLLIINAVVQQQVVRAGFDIDLLAAFTRVHDLQQCLLRAQVHDHDGNVRDLRNAQQMGNRLRLKRIRAALRMRRRGRLSLRLVLRDQRVDHARVLTVNARDAAVFLQFQQRGKQVLIADHHGRICHVHLK